MKIYRKKRDEAFRPIYIKLETEQESAKLKDILGATGYTQVARDVYLGIGSRLGK